MIIARLEKHGIRDDTIILFMGDNGHSAENYRIGVGDHTSGLPKGSNYGANGGGGNTGKWRGHKGNFYEGGIRTPAIISWPKKLPSGAVRDQAVTGQDWYPTILELCKVPLPEVKLDGQSVVPIIRSAKTATHHKLMHWQWEWSWAVREGDWKLMGRNKEASHLGNLSDTEPETKNYIKEKPDIAKRLLDLHNEWLKEVESAYYEQYPNSTKMY